MAGEEWARRITEAELTRRVVLDDDNSVPGWWVTGQCLSTPVRASLSYARALKACFNLWRVWESRAFVLITGSDVLTKISIASLCHLESRGLTAIDETVPARST
jgi:hypothetical protein